MRKLQYEEIAKQRFTISELNNSERFPIYGLLDNIRSLYNVGSMFRTADGARLSKLFLCGYTPYPPRKEIDKTALGATQSVPWQYASTPAEAIKILKDLDIKICVLEHTNKSRPYYDLSKNDFPLCIIVGNEITGISHEFIAHADLAIDIPMYGMKQSLNAAVAFGIAVFGSVAKLNPTI
jgi:tRNA G18 (ribose-2'-O)-methylase SpoU